MFSQQPAGCVGRKGKAGACGKTADGAKLQDLTGLARTADGSTQPTAATCPGIKDIRLSPTLPAFVSLSALDYLVEHYDIAPASTPGEDLKAILG